MNTSLSHHTWPNSKNQVNVSLGFECFFLESTNKNIVFESHALVGRLWLYYILHKLQSGSFNAYKEV